jgi:hypothetical protein
VGRRRRAALSAARGPAEESTFRRAFTLVSGDVLDRVLGAWLHTRAMRAGGRLVIAIDGKTVRGAKNKDGKAPHLVAALAHGIGAVLGQIAVDEKSNEIPAVRDLLKAFARRCGGEPARVDLAALDGALDDGGHNAAPPGDHPFPHFCGRAPGSAEIVGKVAGGQRDRDPQRARSAPGLTGTARGPAWLAGPLTPLYSLDTGGRPCVPINM